MSAFAFMSSSSSIIAHNNMITTAERTFLVSVLQQRQQQPDTLPVSAAITTIVASTIMAFLTMLKSQSILSADVSIRIASKLRGPSAHIPAFSHYHATSAPAPLNSQQY